MFTAGCRMPTCRLSAHRQARHWRRAGSHAACLSALLASLTGTASAQLIPIRTVPIAQADRFEIFPSDNLGMGGVSIGLTDTLFDLSVNPAKGTRLTGARLFGSPIVYSVSENTGGGRALPVGVVARSGSWFGGFSLALQVVDPSQGDQGIFPLAIEGDVARADVAPVAPRRSHGNLFGFAMLGKVWPETGLSVGGSVFWARRHAVDGVDLLYGGSQNVQQFGHAADVRLGVLKEWAGSETLEALLLHARSRMTHDVTYLDTFWDPGTQQVFGRPRLEQNFDYASTWGLHLSYERPLTETGWRIGWLATANRLTQAEMPNYEVGGGSLVSIPWDPGNANAYNLGVGVSRTSGPARFGMDVIYEPIWSHTWSEAEAPTATRLGDIIPPGGKTNENDFRFSNALFRMGVGHQLALGSPERAAGLQLGLAVRWMHYWLAEFDHVQAAGRNHEEEWMEWTPTWGMSLRFPEWEIRYVGRVTSGTSRPGAFGNRGGDVLLVAPRDSPLPGRTDPMPLGGVSVATHQVSVSIPLGGSGTQGGIP